MRLGVLLKSRLYGVSPGAPLVHVGTAAALLVVGLAACVIPGQRAARLDPITALRDESREAVMERSQSLARLPRKLTDSRNMVVARLISICHPPAVNSVVISSAFCYPADNTVQGCIPH